MASRRPHHTAKAKRVIYLFMAGGPSQLDLFDHKPLLEKYSGQKPPESLMSGKRFAFLKGNETLLASPRKFGTYGQCGMTLSDLFPHHRKIVDDVCWMKGVTTDVFNHGPAKLFMNTGFQAPGRASMGSWVTYGLGSEAQDLPGFVVLQSGPRGPRAGAQLWSSGFLPTSFQGVPLRGSGDPILNLNSPAGMTRERERRFYDVVGALNRARLDVTGDPEIPRGSTPTKPPIRCRPAPLPSWTCQRNRRPPSTSTAATRRSPATPGTACSHAASSKKASASCSSITPTGTATAAPAKT
jgi:hypothetical protein